MQTTLTPPARPVTVVPAPRVVETSRGTAHPEHERTRELVRQSLLLRPESAGLARA
jgi:hypothetical protein